MCSLPCVCVWVCVRVCVCALLSVLFMWCCAHTRLVCVYVCVMWVFWAGVRTEPRWRRGSRARPAGGRTDGMVVECLWRVHAYTHTHTHTHTQALRQHTNIDTHRLAGTILASERRSQSHHHSFQEGQPQSHCTGFPTGEGRLEGEQRKEGREWWRKKEGSACVFVSVYVGQGCAE